MRWDWHQIQLESSKPNYPRQMQIALTACFRIPPCDSPGKRHVLVAIEAFRDYAKSHQRRALHYEKSSAQDVS
jgi:hypothetical protein